jgi:hypothetical protein
VGPVAPAPPPEDNGDEDDASPAFQTGSNAVSKTPPANSSQPSRQPSSQPPGAATVSLTTRRAGFSGSAARPLATIPVHNRLEPQSPALSGPGSASIELLTEPPGASITVDSRSGSSCTAPCTLTLAPGRHVLTAQLDGYSLAQRIFNTPQDSSLTISMRPNLGTLIVSSSPAGAVVWVDGREAGPCPITLHLRAGQHLLEAFLANQKRQQSIDIQADAIQGANVFFQ